MESFRFFLWSEIVNAKGSASKEELNKLKEEVVFLSEMKKKYEEAIEKLKSKGHYPYSDLTRESVLR